MQLFFYTKNDHPATNKMFDKLVIRLHDAGFDASWGRSLREGLVAGDLVIAHDSLTDGVESLGEVCVIGQRLLNRRQRLVILEEEGIAVVPWAAPSTFHEVQELFDRWQTDILVHKLDALYRRLGVRTVARGEIVPHNCQTDVFMAPVHGDPRTYKVDLFCDRVLAGRIYDTPPIDAPHFADDLIPSAWLEIPEELADISMRAGRALSHYGVGYFSLDFMRVGSSFSIIEANTSGAGTVAMWGMAPQYYFDRYTKALLDWLQTAGPATSLTEFRRRCERLDALPWAYDPTLRERPTG